MPNFITIEGNIGAGKTTLCDRLGKLNNVCGCIVEPIERYSCFKTHYNPIDNLYKNPADLGLCQLHFMRSSAIHYNKGLSLQSYHTDLPWVSDRDFASTGRFLELYQERLSPFSYHYLKDEYNRLSRKTFKSDVYIYLKTKPEHCAARIAKRARPGEESVSLETLVKFDKILDTWASSSSKPMLYTIEATRESDTADIVYEKVKDLISREFVL